MNKDFAISALRVIHRLIGDTPASPLHGREMLAIENALAQLQAEVAEDLHLRELADDLRRLLQAGLLAVDARKPRRHTVLENCERLMRRIDPAIQAPDW